MDIHALAERLWRAQADRTPCPQLTRDQPELSVAQAYEIQEINLRRRGGRRIGHKIGLTSEAVQSWLGVSEPDFGGLLEDMLIPDGGVAPVSRLLQPRVEAEIAFVLSADLDMAAITSADVLSATAFLLPALEIIDSRIANWTIKYQDTIADNASSGLFVLGSTPVDPRGVSLGLAGMVMRQNGQVSSTGAGAACLGHPLNAVTWLANTMRKLGQPLRRGEIILSGALGPVCDVRAGDEVEAHIAHLGHVRVRFA